MPVVSLLLLHLLSDILGINVMSCRRTQELFLPIRLVYSDGSFQAVSIETGTSSSKLLVK